MAVNCLALFLFGLLTYGPSAEAQSVDSTDRRTDSLTAAVLSTSRTYAHIEEILQCVPAESNWFDLLPCVLPIDAPLELFRVSSPFGLRRHPIDKAWRLHGGVDVAAPTGMPVKATATGIVSQAGYHPVLGAFVRLQHAFGFETLYGHLKGYCVKPGERIALNEEIGRVGKTGKTTGPHLHYVIKKNGSVIDPFQFCFLLRRRLWLHQNPMPTGSGN